MSANDGAFFLDPSHTGCRLSGVRTGFAGECDHQLLDVIRYQLFSNVNGLSRRIACSFVATTVAWFDAAGQSTGKTPRPDTLPPVEVTVTRDAARPSLRWSEQRTLLAARKPPAALPLGAGVCEPRPPCRSRRRLVSAGVGVPCRAGRRLGSLPRVGPVAQLVRAADS